MSEIKGTGLKVPAGLHLQSRFFAATAGLWQGLGDLETAVVSDEIKEVPISKPIYVTSLARAGTTIVTEMLERHPDVTSHRYSDFPNVWTPYWRNYLLQKTRRETPQVQERAHRDRIRVSNDSPEAVEEILWMHFFPGLHDNSRSQVLDGKDRNENFDRFYRDHVRKLLAVRGANRYLAKGNYNIARLRYILDLFADARFLVPVRNPVSHIASLMKQHRLFLSADGKDPRVGRQLALSGHFEFGPGRSYVHFGDDKISEAIGRCWAESREAEGWSRYWAATYRHLLNQLEEQPALRQAVLLFRYEDLCEYSGNVINALLDHCSLDLSKFRQIREEFCQRLSLPQYYRPEFNSDELESIREHCELIYQSLSDYAHGSV